MSRSPFVATIGVLLALQLSLRGLPQSALADLEDDPPADPEWAALQQKMPPGLRPPPVCEPEDRCTFAAFQKSLACRFGFTFPESEPRNQFETIGDSVGPPTAPDWVMRAIGQGQVFAPNARFVDLPGAGHYVFLTKEVEVLREIHSFVAALPMSENK
jgi:pimeloyl-ACP methyl ester carboxylesterase